MKLSLLPILLLTALPLHAQTTPSVAEIIRMAQNSIHMKAKAGYVEWQKQAASSDLKLADPEVQLGYQLGDPSPAVPPRTQINVSQELDFATLSGSKKKVAEQTRRQLDNEYSLAERETMLQTLSVLTELTYWNIRLNELDNRQKQAKRLSDSFQRMLDSGTANAIDANKAIIEAETYAAQKAEAESEQQAWQIELDNLCGTHVGYTSTTYPAITLPTDFDTWFADISATDPQLLLAATTVALAKENERLEKSSTLPRLSVGYSAELVKDNNYHGVAIGFNLPLWNRTSKINTARAAILQAEQQRESDTQRLRTQYRQQWSRATRLSAAAEHSRRTFLNHDNRPLLDKSLAAGKISLIDYLAELTYCHDIIDSMHAADHSAAIESVIFYR